MKIARIAIFFMCLSANAFIGNPRLYAQSDPTPPTPDASQDLDSIPDLKARLDETNQSIAKHEQEIRLIDQKITSLERNPSQQSPGQFTRDVTAYQSQSLRIVTLVGAEEELAQQLSIRLSNAYFRHAQTLLKNYPECAGFRGMTREEALGLRSFGIDASGCFSH